MARNSKNNSGSGCVLVFCIGVIILMAWLALYNLVKEPGILSIILVLIVFGLIALGIVSYLKRTNPKPRKYTVDLSEIDSMEGHDFEYWCANLLRNKGFSRVNVTQGSGDQGVDIIAWKNDEKYAIQCKRYNKAVGNKPVQEVYTGKTIYGCSRAIVITNNYFTPGAIQAAKATNVELWDRNTLAKLI